MSSDRTPRDQVLAAEQWPFVNDVRREKTLSSMRVVDEHPDLEPLTSGVFMGRFDLLWSDYSAGRDLDEIRTDFIALLEEWTPPGRIDAGIRSLEVVVWMRAFGIDLDRHLPAWREDYLDGGSMWTFLGWLLEVESPWEHPLERKARGAWADAIELAQLAIDDPEGSADELFSFVKTRWYRGNRGHWWWNTHKAEDLAKTGRYYGYWCWEAAAIVLMTGVDDSQLKGLKYYPWALVHYLDDTEVTDR